MIEKLGNKLLPLENIGDKTGLQAKLWIQFEEETRSKLNQVIEAVNRLEEEKADKPFKGAFTGDPGFNITR